MLKLVSMASGLASVASSGPAVCPSPQPQGAMLGSQQEGNRHQGPDQPVWLSWRPPWDPGAGPSEGQLRLFLVLLLGPDQELLIGLCPALRCPQSTRVNLPSAS